MNNKFKLPETIAAYYHASDVYDAALLEDCFAEDAVLYDEGNEYRGPAVIGAYILKANREAKVTMEITNCVDQGDVIVVTATLTGEFDGSPLPLDFHFTLNDGKIITLNITTEGE